MLEARNIIKTFVKNEKKGKKTHFNAVDGVSLSVNEGEILGVLGPNGAGKTTLLRILGRLLAPTEGETRLVVGDNILTEDIEVKKHIGYLSGNTKLYGRLSTREHLNLMGAIYGIPREELDERIKEVSKLLSMDEFIDNRVEKLSTGQTQRASIARCLIHNPSVYIFDEPTLGLDIVSSAAIVEFMKREKERGKTIIYSTHYMDEAEYLCDRLILMNHGKAVRNGTLVELTGDASSGKLRDYFLKVLEEEGCLDE